MNKQVVFLYQNLYIAPPLVVQNLQKDIQQTATNDINFQIERGRYGKQCIHSLTTTLNATVVDISL